MDASGLNRTETTTERHRNVLKSCLLDASAATPLSGLGWAELMPWGSEIRVTPVEYRLDPLFASVAKRSFAGQVDIADSWTPDSDPEDPGEKLSRLRALVHKRISEAHDLLSLEADPHSHRTAVRNRWLEIAREQLNDLDAEAEEEGIEPPSGEARAYAVKFINEFSKKDLPPPTVFPDNDCGVSIQMGVKQFIFLLTCFEGGHGIYNAIHDTYRMSGSYNDLSVDDIPGSPFLKYLQCLLSPLSENASLADRTG